MSSAWHLSPLQLQILNLLLKVWAPPRTPATCTHIDQLPEQGSTIVFSWEYGVQVSPVLPAISSL